jgi:uncharacterized protein YuzE
LADAASVDSREVSEGVVSDVDAGGGLVGIDIDQASSKVNLKTITLSQLPVKVENAA